MFTRKIHSNYDEDDVLANDDYSGTGYLKQFEPDMSSVRSHQNDATDIPSDVSSRALDAQWSAQTKKEPVRATQMDSDWGFRVGSVWPPTFVRSIEQKYDMIRYIPLYITYMLFYRMHLVVSVVLLVLVVIITIYVLFHNNTERATPRRSGRLVMGRTRF